MSIERKKNDVTSPNHDKLEKKETKIVARKNLHKHTRT